MRHRRDRGFLRRHRRARTDRAAEGATGRRVAAITLTLAVLSALHAPRADAGVAGRLVMAADGGRSIAVVDVGTGTHQTVASVPPSRLGLPVEVVLDPTWSPRRDRVAYAQSSYLVEPLEGSVRIVDVATRRVRTVLSLPAVSIEGTAWSPRGDRIAFVVGTWYPPVWGASVNHRQVHVIGVDGRGHRIIGPGVEPQWSPNGRSLAYVSPGGLAVVEVDGPVALPRIVTPAADAAGWMHPRWSPDGRRIALLRWRTLGQPELWVTDLRDGVSRPLRVVTWSPPSWAPDGLWLAVADRGIVKVRATDGRRARLTSEEPNEHAAPVWSPDGSVIAFVAYVQWSSNQRIMLADPHSGTTTRVASVPGVVPSMQWYAGS